MAFPDALSSVVDAPTGTETLGGSTPSHTVHTQQLVDAVNETQAATLYRARADRRVFDAVSYGAVVDGSTDDTAAWQAALDAAGAAGGGVVTSSKSGVSVIAGALQDTGGANAQLILPDVHMLDDPQIGITIRGPFEQSSVVSVVGAAVVPTSGLVLQSTLATGSGAVFGAYGSGTSYLNFTFVHLRVENLTVRTVTNPTISALDLRRVDSCTLENVVVDTGQYDTTLTEPTTATSFGLRLPKNNNGAHIRLDGVHVYGFYNGIEFSEHTEMKSASVGGCNTGMVAVAANHASRVGRVLVGYCKYGLRFTGAHAVDIDQWDTEHAASGWYVTTYDVDDASNYGTGAVRWWAVLQNVGAHDSFTINGGANLSESRIGETATGGAATYWRKDRLTASGGETGVELGAAPVADSLLLWVDGVPQWQDGVDYSLAGTAVTFTSALTVGQVVTIHYATATSGAGSASLTTTGINVLDNFNRADASTLGTTSTGAKAWTAHTGTWGIVSNRAYLVSNDTSTRHASIDAGVGGADVTVSAKVYANGDGASRYCGVSGRLDATAANGYMVQINGPAQNIALLKLTAGATTNLGTGPAAYTLVDGDVIELVMSGASLTVKVNGVSKVTATDSSYSSNTRHGLWTYTDQGRFDDFSVLA